MSRKRIISDYAAVSTGPWRAAYKQPRVLTRHARISSEGNELSTITATANFDTATLTLTVVDQRIPEVPYMTEHTSHDTGIDDLLPEGDRLLCAHIANELAHVLAHRTEDIDDSA